VLMPTVNNNYEQEVRLNVNFQVVRTQKNLTTNTPTR